MNRVYKTWEFKNYTVEEVDFDHNLHQFNVVQNDEVKEEINPETLPEQDLIINDLDAGRDVNGWEDGNGNTISID